MEKNAEAAPKSRGMVLTDHQKMACQVIAQAISIALSIRELIRQGYLFSAHILLRPLIERQVILLYLHLFPEDIEKWNRGWHLGDAPGLSNMLEKIQSKWERDPIIRGRDITASLNSLLHAKPDSAAWNMVSLGGGKMGHGVSKLMDHPDLCDEVCAEIIPVLCIIQAMIVAFFGSNSKT